MALFGMQAKISPSIKSKVLEKYASQIEFIENFVDSGAYRFQEYRQAKVLAVGSVPFWFHWFLH